ncbi:MAG: DivIVA domain-containing protein [Clostridia bacterium]|nr:DivIVA domain-containing protein [Clostridia bacterium]
MLKSSEIREVKFSTKAVGGYRQEEVDVLLDKIEADYDWYERNTRDLQAKIDRLEQDMDAYRGTQSSIQNVLLNAQRLADQIVAEARAKSAEIVAEAQDNVDRLTAREKELSASFEEKASKRKALVNQEIESSLRTAKLKNTAMEAAANDAVARQQLLFDKLKLEISAFKADITRKYREHLEMLQKLPDSVPMDPQEIAAAAAAAVDRAPAPESFIPQEQPIVAAVEEAPAAEPTEPTVPPTEPEEPKDVSTPFGNGFSIMEFVSDDDSEE